MTTTIGRESPERAHAPGGRNPDLARIGDPVRAAIAKGTLPCAVIGVADAEGTLHLEAIPGPRHRITTESLFYLASITKPVTATAALALVAEGLLELDAPIVRVIPELAGDGRDPITLRHLLSHTSGLQDGDYAWLVRERPGWDRLLAAVLAQKPEWEPGTRFRYATDPLHLAGEAMARVTGIPFAEVVRQRVLAPLGMTESGFDARPRRRRVVPVDGLPMRNPITREVLLRFAARSTIPGGGLFSTAEDLLRFGRAIVRGGAGVLDRTWTDEMLRDQTAGIPAVHGDGSTDPVSYALCWGKRIGMGAGADGPAIRIPGASAGAATHGGASGTRLVVDPERGLVIVVLSAAWYQDERTAWETVANVYAAWEAAGR